MLSYEPVSVSGLRGPPSVPPVSASVSKSAAKRNAAAAKDEKADTSFMPSLNQLREKRAWELALSPAKSIPMQGFMMWMSGGGVQIFSLMMAWMLVKGAVTQIMQVNKVFLQYSAPAAVAPSASPAAGARPTASTEAMRGNDLLPQKAVWIVCQGLLLALGLYKAHSMGLLPTSSSDWLAFLDHSQVRTTLWPSYARRRPSTPPSRSARSSSALVVL